MHNFITYRYDGSRWCRVDGVNALNPKMKKTSPREVTDLDSFLTLVIVAIVVGVMMHAMGLLAL